MSHHTQGETSYRQLAEELRQAVGRFVRATRARTDTLPPMRAEALGQLDREGPQTIAQLAAGRGVRHQSMSRMVAELEDLGLIEKIANPADGRGFVISLSPTGRAALDTDRAARRDHLAAAIAENLDDAERRALAAVPDLLAKLGH
ncbi:MarR family winged helix-turn-helix transcriptional regulator [Actinoallomurus iriomotensis]|uniref:MarR family transcriptional regulator n=1 Tax=Actinoallomurus iriomotensis TaxID=478107 RepID=A0A9W6SG88_9ACTN|nr:MarR family transcriptional regulator [Actinoallomurus iriomotensis]GLY92327.1 MarR family transcriptional regulator [Actinoallomurus iriomotensis]